MAGTTLMLEIITPEKVALREEVTSVTVPAVDGSLGIWPNHAPLLAGLKAGVVRYKGNSGEKTYEISGGFLEVANNVVTMIAGGAMSSANADEFAATEARLRTSVDHGDDVTRAEKALAKNFANEQPAM